MTAKEIYNWPPESTSKDIGDGLLSTLRLSGYLPENHGNKHVELKSYINHDIDGNRYISMSSVWFKNKPVMICQEAGRGGKDHNEHFITDSSVYIEMVKYVRSLITIEEDDIDVLDPTVECKELTNFYGINASELYDPNLKPKYKLGDIVMASVKEDHLRYDNRNYIETRCKITQINSKDPDYTYHMDQLDRRWENDKEKKARGCIDFTGNMVFDKNKGQVGARGNDKTILHLI